MASKGKTVSREAFEDAVVRLGGPAQVDVGQIWEHFNQGGFAIGYKTCARRLNKMLKEWRSNGTAAPASPGVTEERLTTALTNVAATVASQLQDVKDQLDAVDSGPRTYLIKLPDKKRVHQIKDVVLPPEFDRMVRLANLRQNQLMVGPSGSGKTFLADKVAKALKLKFAAISCSVGMSESQIMGYLLPTAKGGQFEYVQTPFIDRFENGGLFLFDEIDAADANTLIVINAAMANGVLHVPQRHKNPVVKKHPDCVIMAAANTYGHGGDRMFVGRGQLDAATLDRFRAGVIYLDYNKDVERSLSSPEICEWGWAVREIISRNGYRRILSTRLLKDANIQVQDGLEFDALKVSYFSDWSRDELNSLPHDLLPEDKDRLHQFRI